MKENPAFEDSSGLSRAKIEATRDRLLQMRTLTLAVTGNDACPELGVSPYVQQEDGLYIYTSHLSQHVRDLMQAGTATCLICADEGDSQNIWARNRLKFSVRAVEVARDDARFNALCDMLETAHGPTMGLIRNFADFHMFHLQPHGGVLVMGFAKAFRVSGPRFEIAAHLSEA
jgi:putative heme iron utilization protein